MFFCGHVYWILFCSYGFIFVILRFIHGLFWGISTVSTNTIAIDIIPSSRRAEGIGYFGLNMNIAMAIAPFIAVLIYNSYGFHTLITAAISMGCLGVSAAIFYQSSKKAKSCEYSCDFTRSIFFFLKGW